ncbi:MAG: SDR family NAD(P)-dependent oxidoreductase [Acidobacteriota bacterium]
MSQQSPLAHRLNGRSAIVAGGGGGIGAAIVSQLLAGGCRVASLDLPDHPGPGGSISLACDLSVRASVDAAVSEASAVLGGFDIVVHGAGIARDALIARMGDDEWGAVLATNLNSAFYLLRACIPVLRERGGGSVVLVSSINGERAKAGQANYAASKAGMNALARTAARELGRFGIRVNAVAPGWIETPLTAALRSELREKALGETALGRLGQPDDVASVVVFLTSELSRHVTGQVWRVDGGQLIG